MLPALVLCGLLAAAGHACAAAQPAPAAACPVSVEYLVAAGEPTDSTPIFIGLLELRTSLNVR